VEQLCMPPPSLAEAYAVDEEAMCWIVASTPNRNALNVVCPLSRCYGEINIAYQTLRALAGQTSEEQAQLDNPLRLKAEAQAADRAFTLNFPRMLTRPALRAMVGPIDLRTRLVTKQRGNRTVLELFRLKDQTGEFPATLDAVTGDFKTDPYSGRPFVYRRAGDDFVLYSVGIDADDDGGTHHARFGERPAPGPDQPAPPPDGDYVFWPIPGVDR